MHSEIILGNATKSLFVCTAVIPNARFLNANPIYYGCGRKTTITHLFDYLRAIERNRQVRFNGRRNRNNKNPESAVKMKSRLICIDFPPPLACTVF